MPLKSIIKKISRKLQFGNTLYYPGCLTHFVLPGIEENYKGIFRKMGIDFIFLPEFRCCGSPVRNAGYSRDFQALKKKNIEQFKRHGITRIVTNCPACYRVISDYGLNAEHATQLVWKNIMKTGPAAKAGSRGRITYHDPCHLGRHSGIYDEPRNILRHIGYAVAELPGCREKSLCCGGGGGMKSNCPLVSDDIARKILAQVKTRKLVTPCPMCYRHFRDNAPKDIEVLEFSEVLVK